MGEAIDECVVLWRKLKEKKRMEELWVNERILLKWN
jgi:hypothetical protein